MTANTLWFIYNFNSGLIKELRKSNYIIVVGPYDEYYSQLEELVDEVLIINFKSRSINPFSGLLLIQSYFSLFKKSKPDLILSYTIKPNIFGNFAARFLEIPVINTITGLGTIFINQNYLTKVGELLYNIALKKSNHVFFLNSSDLNYFVINKIIDKKRCSIVPGSGVNTKLFNVVRNNNKADKFLFVGRLIGDKGLREYVEAANIVLKTYPHKEFHIIGEFSCDNITAIKEDELNLWLLNPCIKYLGKTDNIVKELEKVDVIVLPSYREGLSKSLIEAASMKLPIICTNVPGCNDVVINNYNGLLCKVRDSNDLASKITKMIEFQESDRILMGKNGRQKVINEFSEEIVISKYTDLIKLFKK